MLKTFCFLYLFVGGLYAQDIYKVSGKIIDNYTNQPLENVKISLINGKKETRSNKEGLFYLDILSEKDFLLSFKITGYEIKNIPLVISPINYNFDLGLIRLTEKTKDIIKPGFIYLNDSDLTADEKGESNSITGILSSTKNLFLKTAAYEFSSTFFKPRNLGSEYAEVQLNGMSLNKLYNGRPQWGNIGGLNDALRNQEFSAFLSTSPLTFGRIAGTTNILTKSSNHKKSTKISYASSNKSYQGRVMVSYQSGLLQNGWAYTFSASRRYANQGFKEGTLYDANSFFASIEKIINKKHSFNLTAIYASNQRGKSSPNTQEVYDLKNLKYNAYWGNQESQLRNSRIKKIVEPIFQISHYWNINSKTHLQTNISYQFGKMGNSRLDYGGARIISDNIGNVSFAGGGSNPDPTYYQKLPSYFLRDTENPDYTNAYLAEQEFLINGQIKWEDLYQANQNNLDNQNSIYALYEDRTDDKQLTINTILYKKIKKNIVLNAAISYQKLISENFANMLDLLGGSGFLDVDAYETDLDLTQNDLQNPNRIITKNEHFKYDFILDASVLNGFMQTKVKTKKTDAFLALNITSTNYLRTGLYENGAYPGGASLGKSKRLSFLNFGIKSGLDYKFNGRNIFSLNTSFSTKAPYLQNSFSNVRENNAVVIGLTDEKIIALDVRYFLRHPKINASVSAYGVLLKNLTNISFYFADGLVGLEDAATTAFVQEVLTGIDKQNIGLEFSLEVPIINGLKLKGVAAIGQAIYTSNPNLYLTSDDFKEPLNYGEVSLKNYFVEGGPQQAYSVGFEYSSPKYWWFGASSNYFRNAYLNIAPITRTNNFTLDPDGLPFNDYDEEIARKLLKQEKFTPYFLVNIVGGKSWKINKYYFGFFANISNVLNQEYKTGGFEQSRNANYHTLLEDKSREKPLFGPKYWLGYGTSYYASVYFRF